MVEEKEPAHVVQARQELANAQSLGNDESAAAARKRLAAAGVQVAARARKTAAEAAVAEESTEHVADKARAQPPAGRRAPGKATT